MNKNYLLEKLKIMKHKSFFLPWFIILFITTITLFFSGCAVPICDQDIEKPLISIRITGPGSFREFRSNDPATHGDFLSRFVLYMPPNTTYSFVATIIDPCGAQLLNIRFFQNLTLTELRDINGTPLTATSVGNSKVVTVRGMIEGGNVKNALVITGKFTTPDLHTNTASSYLEINGFDYGGRSRSPNSAIVNLGLYIDAGRTPGEVDKFPPTP